MIDKLLRALPAWLATIVAWLIAVTVTFAGWAIGLIVTVAIVFATWRVLGMIW